MTKSDSTKSHPYPWIFPLIMIIILGGFFSMRQLSDPDLGFHLKYGKWIVDHKTVPEKDQSTYTVPNNEYVDVHWLFQVLLYTFFKIIGYPGLSILVCIITLCLLSIILTRLRLLKIPPGYTCTGILLTLIIIEPSFGPHPELLTFVFIAILLLVLDLYFHKQKNLLFLLPVIQLLWCNMHGLFIIGFILSGSYFLSLWKQKRKFDFNFLLWYGVSILICLANPYFFKGILFPLELATRFNPNNLFNQHIQEFIPFFKQPHFVLRDYLFLFLLISGFLLVIATFRKRLLHELILVPVFSILALVSIRNIPLFVLISIPVCLQAASELNLNHWKRLEASAMLVLLVITALMIPRVATDSWYLKNNSFSKTGTGLDAARQPFRAALFLKNNRLNGRILNSMGFGGWLSWDLDQPVFIDGRLEVMKEGLYQEIRDSWYNGLPLLVERYHPDLIVYNYLVYYPWTIQIAKMDGWRLIYIDGSAAVYTRPGYATNIPAIDINTLPSNEGSPFADPISSWLKGFYQPVNYLLIESQHKAHFRYQLKSVVRNNYSDDAVRFFNSGNEKYRHGNIQGAVEDLTNAVKLNPNYIKALNNRAVILALDLKNYSAAFADFDQILNIDPDYSDAWLGRGTAFYLQEKLDSACVNWHRAAILGNAQAERLIGLHCNTK